jgi:hypothetical protein
LTLLVASVNVRQAANSRSHVEVTIHLFHIYPSFPA